MRSIVRNPKDPNELQFLQALLEKLGVESKVLSTEQMEDIGLSFLLKEADRDDRVSEAEVMQKLKGK